jgi:hypothetical protein
MWFPILVRLPLAVAGMIASWFVAEGSLRHDLVQMGIALVMLATFIIFMIFAPRLLRRLGFFRKH